MVKVSDRYDKLDNYRWQTKLGRNLQILNWGFNSLNTSQLLINARSETVHQKVTFSKLLRFQRCLIPANSWF